MKTTPNPSHSTPFLKAMTLLRKPGRLIQQLGWGNAFFHAAGRLGHSIFGERVRIVRYLFVAQPVPADSGDAPQRAATMGVRQIVATDPIASDFPRPAKVIAERFKAGSECFVAESRGQFAGFLWLARGAYEEDEVRCRYELSPSKHCAWDFDVYVAPEFRMGRAFLRLWQAANMHMASQDIEWSLSRISTFNPESISAHRRMGSREITTATFFVFGRLQVSVFKAPPYLNVCASRRNRPVLKLSPPMSHE